MKSTLKRGGFETLNVYSTSGGGTWAGPTCRARSRARSTPILDGVVIH